MTLAVLPMLAALAAPPTPLPGKGEPVVVDADQLQYAPRRREIVFTGKPGAPVVLTRGDARLSCERVVAKNDERGRIQTATCVGDVRFTRGERVITCATATYDDPAARLTCEGAPVTLREPGIDAQGTRLVYELATDEVTLLNTRGKIAAERIDEAQERQAARRGEKRP